MNSPRKKLILWVDDEIEFLRAHIMFLEEHQYEVVKANNGDDALALVHKQAFDLVFMDEQMPGKDGLTTMEEIKSYDPSIPVVMVTKSEEEQVMEEAWGRDVDGYLIKPVNPSQILAVCKRIFHQRALKKTHLTSEYVIKYSQYKAKFMTNQTPADWSGLFYHLCKWDVQVQSLRDNGLELTHENHRNEVSKKFLNYLGRMYIDWVKGRSENPTLTPQIIKNKLTPKLLKNEKVVLVVLSGFRVDHWLTLRQSIEQHFLIKENIAWSILPTDRNFCLPCLLSGQYPRQISLESSSSWKKTQETDQELSGLKELFFKNLHAQGIKDLDQSPFIQSMGEVSPDFSDMLQNPSLLWTLLYDWEKIVSDFPQQESIAEDALQKEQNIRTLIKIWFESSSLRKLLTHCALNGRKVLLTADHGGAIVTEPVEVFCQEEQTPHPRLKSGSNISCDERHVHFIESPSQYQLPGIDGETSYALAKENHYFTYPNKYQYFGSRFKGQMVSGGVSLYEVMVPLVELIPKPHF